MTIQAYDYETQEWVTGAAAAVVRRKQIREELQLIESVSGAEYLRSLTCHESGCRMTQAEHAAAMIADLRAELTSLYQNPQSARRR